MISYLLAAVLAQQTPPAAAPLTHNIYGVGGLPCSSWTRAKMNRNAMEFSARLSWLAGYISALGRMREIDEPVAGLVMREASPWFDRHCRRNPGQPLHEAAQELIAETRARLRAAGSPGN